MAPPKEVPPAYVEIKPANFSMDGDLAKEHKATLPQAMAAAAIKAFKPYSGVTHKLPPGTKTGYTMAGTLKLMMKGANARAEASLRVNNWPQDSLFMMGSAGGNTEGGVSEGLIKDLAEALVEDFVTKKLIPKFKELAAEAKKELAKQK